jgi:pyruvate kinase
MTIYRDVRPMLSKYEAFDRDALLRACQSQLLEAGVVEQGDLIVLTIGEPIGKAGGTNTLKLVRVGEH